MRCSVVIPVHNRVSLTRHCLETILGDPDFRAEAEVIVVDDGSSDGTSELLLDFGDDIRVVTHPRPTGFATACNDGAAGAAGHDLVFLNNDTIPVPGWLGTLIDYADAHPQAAVVGAKLLFPNDTIQHAGMTIGEDRNPRHIYAGFPANHPAVNKSRRVPAVTAACAFLRRLPFEEAGGFDDAFQNGFEDVDLCFRLAERGCEIHYCHESVAYHMEMGTRDFRDELPNLDLYRRRWAHKVHPDAITRYLEDGLMEIEYHVRYPFSLRASPLLAVVDEANRTRELERTLAERSEENTRLMRENVRLRILVVDAGLEAPSVSLSPPKAELPPAPRAALFISGVYGDAKRYRCDHHAEELALLGASADSHWIHELALDDVGDWYGCFVLHRVALDEHVEAFIKAAKRHSKAVVYDADEFVFEPAADHEAKSQSATMTATDAVFAATEPLAQRARLLNENVFVIPIAASQELVTLSEEARRSHKASPDGELLIACVSYSPTTSGDFSEVGDVLLSLLSESPGCRLLLLGEPELDPGFDRFRDRIEQLPILPWRRVPPLLAQADVVIAPREQNNAAAEARACREWLEAALVGVPTVASPTTDFRRVIEPGINGLLARSPDEWQAALGELIGSSDRRSALGQAAHETAMRAHTTGTSARVLYGALGRVTARIVGERRLSLNVLVGSGPQGGSNARELSKLAGQLGWRGHRVRLFADTAPGEARASVELCKPTAQPLPPADATLVADVETARAIAADPRSMFTFLIADGSPEGADDLPVQRIDADSIVDSATLERLLLDLCFARLDPAQEDGNRE